MICQQLLAKCPQFFALSNHQHLYLDLSYFQVLIFPGWSLRLCQQLITKCPWSCFSSKTIKLHNFLGIWKKDNSLPTFCALFPTKDVHLHFWMHIIWGPANTMWGGSYKINPFPNFTLRPFWTIVQNCWVKINKKVL